MASTINAKNTSSGVVITPDSSGNLSFQTADTTAMTIDTSQNVGIGTSSPATSLHVFAGTAGPFAGFRIGQNDGYAQIGTDEGGMLLYTGTTERMRIDSSGNVLVNQTTTTPTSTGVSFQSGTVFANGFKCHPGISGATWGNTFNLNFTTGTQLWIDSTNQGTISVSSDYRIKQNVETQTTPALERIAQIRPVTYEFADYEPFNWKADGVAREGFIAHELAEVVPSAVEGEKDAENQIQSLKLDALCSVMVKAIQEQQAIITDLKARIEALKGAA